MGMSDRWVEYARIDKEHDKRRKQLQIEQQIAVCLHPYSCKMKKLYSKKKHTFIDKLYLNYLRKKIDSIYNKYQ